MLCLSRKVGEEVMIGDAVVVGVDKVGGEIAHIKIYIDGSEIPLAMERDDEATITVGGDDIDIMVVSVGQYRAKLGFTAPPGVKIHRMEIYNKLRGR